MDYKQILGLNADNGPHPGPTPQYPHFAHPAEYYSAPVYPTDGNENRMSIVPVIPLHLSVYYSGIHNAGS